MEIGDRSELVEEFLEEAGEFLDELEGQLLRLEQEFLAEPDPDLLASILSGLHTFKGNSGMMGFASLQKYAHDLEDLFKALQAGVLQLDEGLAEALLESASALRRGLDRISPEEPKDPSLSEETAALEALLADKEGAGERRDIVSNAAAANSKVLHHTNVIRVDFQRLDHLLNLMGELVIYRTRLGQVEARLKEALGEKGLILDLSDASEQIGKVATELHEAIMRVRMLPIKHVLTRFPRFVRDLARERGKEVTLLFEGEDTELDKTVIDEIGEPLLHLIRNAIDHGIERPEQREARRKPRQGTILIRASQESSHIVIVLEDDGQGIDEDRLRQRAARADFLPTGDLDRQELLNLIFLPGLSTAEAVTEVSGRGIGMDVVKTSLARIAGTIHVESERGQGARFTIKLPLTLAIISALMVRVGPDLYAVPLASVVETVKLPADSIHVINHSEVVNFRDRVLPLARLSVLFGGQTGHSGEDHYVVVVQGAEGQIGIVVDSLLGGQEIVIKALDDYLGDAPGIAGATILGDGRVVLILDVPGLTASVGPRSDSTAERQACHE